MVFQEVAGLVAISMNVIGRHVVVTQNVAITTEATPVPATVAIQVVVGLVAISMNAIGRHVVVTQDVAITAEATRVPAIVAIRVVVGHVKRSHAIYSLDAFGVGNKNFFEMFNKINL